jgi:predicted HNH restriction endonuclease
LGKKLLTTPRSRVRAALRQLWLRSRERAAALKREGYTCEGCHRKQSKAKGKEFALEVHHLNGVEWEKMIDYVYRHLLVNPIVLEVLCPECHKKEHAQDKGIVVGRV